jgi:predicted N-formylglutamate amidohydrolase
VEIIGGPARVGVLVVCDHASNRLPTGYATLGLDPAQLGRHIAHDIGAAGVTRGLAARLGAPAVLSRFSRLLIDPNRGLDDPTLIMRVSDGAVIPGNRHLDVAERQRRIDTYYAPYHGAVSGVIDTMFAAGYPPVLVSIHSFTPVWRGVPRPWHCGVLWDKDPRLAVPLIEAMRGDPELMVGDNQPYSGVLLGDTMWQHGTRRGLAHAIIEVRQDLIAEPSGQSDWADRIAAWVDGVIDGGDLADPSRRVAFYGSWTDV